MRRAEMRREERSEGVMKLNTRTARGRDKEGKRKIRREERIERVVKLNMRRSGVWGKEGNAEG